MSTGPHVTHDAHGPDPADEASRPAAEHGDPAPAQPVTVLVYSDDPKTREQVLLAVGRRPASDLPRIDYVEFADGDSVVAAVDDGGIDLAILDGEASPTGGLGLCRQLKNEVRECPPILLLTGRRDDRWLAVWSQADGAVPQPIDAMLLVDTVVDLLRTAGRRSAVIKGR
jgi:DNA-binding response OmpR family regulator